MICTICHQSIFTAAQRYLIDSRKGQLNVRELLSNLPFSVTICSAHVCKTCLQKLKKRQALKDQEAKILEEIKMLTSLCGHGGQVELLGSSQSKSDCVVDVGPKRFRADISNSLNLISPIRGGSVQSTTPVSNAPLHSTPRKQSLSRYQQTEFTDRPQHPTGSSSIPVSVRVQWPSKIRERCLNEDLERLGKMLVRGTYKQIARASWQNPKLRKELQVLVLKDVDKECHALCSRKRPSCLRSPSKEQLKNFSFDKLNTEMKNRAPFLRAILHTACVNNRNASRPKEWMPTICMAAAVLLRNRSSRLNAVQLLLSIFLYHSSWTVSKCMCTVVIHTCALYIRNLVIKIFSEGFNSYLYYPLS